MATLDGSVGPAQLGDAAAARGRFDNQASLMVSEMNGRYAELSKRGHLEMACNSSGVALSTVSATVTGFCLNNPTGSGYNFELIHIAVALTTAPAGIANIHLEYGLISATLVTHTTPLVVRSGMLEAFTPVGLVDSSATIPAAPVAIRAIGGGPNATGSVTTPFISDEVAGAIIIQPGSTLNVGYFTTAISAVVSMMWAKKLRT